MIPPQAEEFMATSMGATVHTLWCPIPKADLANLIAEAARSIEVSASLSPR
jgi:hypothetical protein